MRKNQTFTDRQKDFYQWLSGKVSASLLSELYMATADIDEYGKKHHRLEDTLFELGDAEHVMKLRQMLQGDRRYQFLHYGRSKQMIQLLQKYGAFLGEREKTAKKPVKVESTPVITTKQNNPEISAAEEHESSSLLKQEQSKPEDKVANRPQLDKELQELLNSEDYMALRNKLVEQKVLTLEQFKALDLWVFMNRYGLYTIAKRQEIYKQIRTKLNPPKKVDTDRLYMLKTKSGTTFYGESPAEAFAAFCEKLAQRYPLKFRTLIGQQYNGQGSVVLQSAMPREGGIKLSNPTTFISSSLSPMAAENYGKWLCKICGEQDVPVSMTAPIKNNDQVAASSEKAITSSQEKQVKKESLSSTKDGRLKQFELWLREKEHLADRSASAYRSAIKVSEEYIEENFLGSSLILGSVEHAVEMQKLLMSIKDYAARNKTQNNRYSAALAQYISFLRSFDGTIATGSEVIIVPETVSHPHSSSFAEQLARDGFAEEKTEHKPSSETEHQLHQAEKFVLEMDLDGITVDELSEKLHTTIVQTKKLIDQSTSIVSLARKLVHKDAFVDWEEGAAQIESIIEKLLDRNNGYASSAQLYEYARAEMQMFLNDNDMADEDSVYYIARHLFEKVGWNGKHYAFSWNGHISRGGKESLQTNLDVFNKYARDQGGFFRYDDLVDYLEQVGIKTGNLRGQMCIGSKPYFFYYSSEYIITSESMKIDAAWLKQVDRALKRLFEDSGDHIVIRSIMSMWFEQLPTLPGYIPWTPLLLQYVLQFYGKQLGVRTIGSELNQKYDVLHAMLVTKDSVIQTFADTVVAYLVDNDIEQRQFDAEELRCLLVNGGLIAGNELIWHMPKAIGKDPRFVWNASGEKVSIKV